uniref:SH3 domain-containing protein n=1 Tax=Meleagris gallopavo TaxID=9103 RepID=A0A803YQ27_MELGA
PAAMEAEEVYVLVEYGFEYRTKDGTVVSIHPNERYVLLGRTNEHWWHVRRSGDARPFYVPAQYVKELPPMAAPGAGGCHPTPSSPTPVSKEGSFWGVPYVGRMWGCSLIPFCMGHPTVGSTHLWGTAVQWGLMSSPWPGASLGSPLDLGVGGRRVSTGTPIPTPNPVPTPTPISTLHHTFTHTWAQPHTPSPSPLPQDLPLGFFLLCTPRTAVGPCCAMGQSCRFLLSPCIPHLSQALLGR